MAGATIISSCSPTPPTASDPAETDAAAVTPATRDRTTLRLLYSQVPLTLNPHLATGIQDFEAGRIVYEPLATTDERGELVPILAAAIPTVEDGSVAADGKSVTWQLQPDVQWADGEPLTAEDVVFTFDFVSNPQVGAATAQYYEAVESVEAIDELTVKITFKDVTAAWQIPFTGQTGVILPQHLLADVDDAATRSAEVNQQPIGTGPYQVVERQPWAIVFEPNPTYRASAPIFQTVELVGGLAPYAAAREVLSTGEADFAHNLQVEVALLKDLQQDGQGVVDTVFG